MNRLPCSWKAMAYEPESTGTLTRICLLLTVNVSHWAERVEPWIFSRLFKSEIMDKVLLKRKYVGRRLDWIQQERADELDLTKQEVTMCLTCASVRAESD
jgi:hypothetical protein